MVAHLFAGSVSLCRVGIVCRIHFAHGTLCQRRAHCAMGIALRAPVSDIGAKILGLTIQYARGFHRIQIRRLHWAGRPHDSDLIRSDVGQGRVRGLDSNSHPSLKADINHKTLVLLSVLYLPTESVKATRLQLVACLVTIRTRVPPVTHQASVLRRCAVVAGVGPRGIVQRPCLGVRMRVDDLMLRMRKKPSLLFIVAKNKFDEHGIPSQGQLSIVDPYGGVKRGSQSTARDGQGLQFEL
mmetsp:Transcript_14011/g.33989  ORF Transcript_14011/g.33989 Transcript_14011/m.33989 type:complete len:240 (+) Transcript_14011:376-1095(+)